MICTLFIYGHIFTFKHLCLHSITKIPRNGPKAHFPFKMEPTSQSLDATCAAKEENDRVGPHASSTSVQTARWEPAQWGLHVGDPHAPWWARLVMYAEVLAERGLSSWAEMRTRPTNVFFYFSFYLHLSFPSLLFSIPLLFSNSNSLTQNCFTILEYKNFIMRCTFLYLFILLFN